MWNDKEADRKAKDIQTKRKMLTRAKSPSNKISHLKSLEGKIYLKC